jgi:hypothetical protein
MDLSGQALAVSSGMGSKPAAEILQRLLKVLGGDPDASSSSGPAGTGPRPSIKDSRGV